MLIKDLEKLGYDEVILKSDGEPALRAVQEEVRRRRGRTAILENSPPGESQSNGVAERAVRAVAEHVRVHRWLRGSWNTWEILSLSTK